MRIVAALVAISIALAALKAAAAMLLLALLGALLISALVQPRETLGCLLGLAALGLVGRYPIAAFIVLAVLLMLGAIRR